MLDAYIGAGLRSPIGTVDPFQAALESQFPIVQIWFLVSNEMVARYAES